VRPWSAAWDDEVGHDHRRRRGALPDEEAGEVPKAFVVASSELSAQEVMAWVAERVAPHKKVRIVEFVDEIPKSLSGKILRRVLMERDRQAAVSSPPG